MIMYTYKIIGLGWCHRLRLDEIARVHLQGNDCHFREGVYLPILSFLSFCCLTCMVPFTECSLNKDFHFSSKKLCPCETITKKVVCDLDNELVAITDGLKAKGWTNKDDFHFQK